MNLNDYATHCHQISKSAGWWNDCRDWTGKIDGPWKAVDFPILGLKISLIHSEISEMLEGMRKGGPDDHLPDRPAEEVEAVDALIRLFDYAGARGLDLDGAFHDKVEYNKNRPDHKPEARAAAGGKRF